MKRILSILVALVMVLSLVPAVITAETTEAAISVKKTDLGNMGAVLAVETTGIRGAKISAVSSDEAIASVRVNGSTVTVTGREGAVGIASITVTAEGAGGRRAETVMDVPIGYTAFFFDGNSVTVVEGADTKYEVTGQNPADELDHALTVTTDASGNTVYTNNDDATLVVSIKKAGGAYVFAGTCTDGAIAVKKEATGNTWLLLNNLDLTSSFTSPITIKKDSTACTVITALAGTENTLTDAALNDADTYGPTEDGGNGTNQYFAESAVIKAKANTTVYINGTGTLNINSNSKNGIKSGEGAWMEIADVNLVVTSPKNGISVENELVINSGTLNVTASGNDGIKASDDTETIGKLTIAGGDITVNAADEGVMASGSVSITGGTLNITAGGDAIKAENGSETAGDVFICGGTIGITTQCDGIQAAGSATFRGGSVTILARNGSSNTSYNKDSDPSAKGIKAGDMITFYDGTFNINSADDALHSNNSMTILGGTFTLATTDDGVHADYTLNLGEYNGDNSRINLTVNTCYEGIEAAHINCYSGTYYVWTNEDCINAANSDLGNGYGFTLRMWGGDFHFYGSTGDGLDSNGELTVCGATVEVYSPGNGNAALDSDGTMSIINGSTVMAVGASDMVETPSYGVYVRFGSSGGWGGGSSVSFANGDTIAVYNSSNTKLYESTVHYLNANSSGTCAIFASPQLTSGQTYKLYKNGSQVTTATATGSSGGTTPTPGSSATPSWKAVGEPSTAYSRMTSMTAGIGAVITNTSNSYALTGGSSVSGTSVSVSSTTGGYSITNVSDANTWYRTGTGKLYCTVNGTDYYLAYTKSSSGWTTTYTINTTTDAESAPAWTVSANGNYARITTTPGGAGNPGGGGPGGPGQTTTLYLTASGSSFTLSTSSGNVYVYQPDTAMAALTGTLDYVLDYDNGESVTQAQILANASVLFKTGVNATQQTLAWTDSRVSYAWNPEFSATEPGVYEMNVYVLDTYLGAIRVIATSANLGSTAPEPLQYEIPEWPTDPTPTPDPTEPPTGLMGDVNLNGTVDASDALIVLRYAMNLITLTDEQLAVADMNGNGKVDATDAVLIMRYALGVSNN